MTDAYYLSLEWTRIKGAVLKRDGYRCTNAECTTPRVRLNVHHRIERNDGGSDRMSNLRTLCQSCHSRLTGYARAGVRGADVDGNPNKPQPAQDSWKKHRFD